MSISRRSFLQSLSVLICAASLLAAQDRQPSAPIRLLTIGNSFAGNSTSFLAQLAESQNIPITIYPANIGGAELERHVRHLRQFSANPGSPEGRPYGAAGKPKYSLVEALKAQPWDYVTIQQASLESYKPETYEPYARQLIEVIHQYAPQAKILVHQTWAYREDHPLFADGKLNQRSMYNGLRGAYDQLATTYGLAMLPVGDAFQAARATPMWRFAGPDKAFDYEHPAPGTLPDQAGSLNVGWAWQTNAKTGAKQLVLDARHANPAGRYLGGCVFFEVLTGRSATSLTWRPKDLTEAQAVSLRAAAHQAVEARQGSADQHRLVDAAIPSKAPARPKKQRRILVCTLNMRDGKVWRSSSYATLPAMRYAIEQLGKRTGAFEPVFSDDVEMFRPANLRRFDAVFFANTTGVLFDDPELRKSLLDFIASGKGFIGIHDAIATFVQYPKYDQWPAFGQMLGGTENGGHPWNGELMTVKVDDPRSPLTAMFHGPQPFRIADQAFQLQEPSFRDRLHVLLSIDTAATPLPPNRRILPVRKIDMDFPVSWVKTFGKGRVFYSTLGHGPDIFYNSTLLQHFLAGIQYATGDLKVKDKPDVPKR